MSTPEIEQLLQPMLKMRLFAAISKCVKPVDEILPFVPEHLQYMIALEKQGVLFASGPFVEPGVVVSSGLTILRATDLAQAQAYMNEEPLIKRSLRQYELWEWELREGYFQVGIEFATGRYVFK